MDRSSGGGDGDAAVDGFSAGRPRGLGALAPGLRELRFIDSSGLGVLVRADQPHLREPAARIEAVQP